jgi:archaellin
MRRNTFLALALLAPLAASAAQAQQRNRGITVDEDSKQTGVELTLDLKVRGKSADQKFASVCDPNCSRADSAKLPLNTEVSVCFKATAEGFVTVWSIDSKGGFDLIYPNKLSHPAAARAAAVTANSTTCIGEDEKFKLKISPPSGASRVYLHWTKTEDEQFGMDDYPVIGRDLRASPPYAATNVQYDIVN